MLPPTKMQYIMPKARRRRRLWSRFFGRDGDQRSVLGKEIQEYLVDREHSPAMMQKIVELRGDLSSGWRERHVPCLYCGCRATEVDHYKSAVKGGKISPYLDCPINRVPSCSKCHRGGKDHPAHAHKTILQWFDMTANLPKNHPRKVMRRAGHSEDYVKAVRRRLETFDRFHSLFAPRMSLAHLEAAQTFVERVLLFRKALFNAISRYEDQNLFRRRNYVRDSNELFEVFSSVTSATPHEPPTCRLLESSTYGDNPANSEPAPSRSNSPA